MAPVPATIPYWIYLLATALSILGLCIILANSFVMAFYKKKWKEIVPLMYLMMAVCDSVTGFVVLGHAVIFVNHGIALSQLLQDKNEELYYSDVFTIAVYIILQSCTRASLFYNTVLTVVRTINIARPFYLIRKHIVIVFAILYPILWVTICTIDVVVISNNNGINGTTLTGMTLAVLLGYNGSISLELTVIVFMVIPLFLPTILALVSAVIQIYSILKPSIISSPSVRERNMTVTIIMLTMLCLVCNIPYTMFIVLFFFDIISSYQPSHLYTMSTVLPFIQALLNPVILISRGAALRQFAFKVVTGPFKKRNTADGVETEIVIISNEANVGTQGI